MPKRVLSQGSLTLKDEILKKFMWKKSGLLISPQFTSEFAFSHAALPFAFAHQPGKFDIYFSSRDVMGRSRIFRIAAQDQEGQFKVTGDIELVLDLGELGAFDDRGVMPSWLLRADDGNLFLYYTGWSLGQTVPFYFYIGLAISKDGGKNFSRYSKAPILGRSSTDPFLTSSPCVLRCKDRWKMWYGSGVRWERVGNEIKHYYNIRYAESLDGIAWKTGGEPCITFKSSEEYAIARPCVIQHKDRYLMWFAARGSMYRLGFATSKDGIQWSRSDDLVGLELGPQEWDSKMMAYSHVFKSSDRWLMLYNGNEYGKSGIGLALCDSIDALIGNDS
jgi:hypothetical protein